LEVVIIICEILVGAELVRSTKIILALMDRIYIYNINFLSTINESELHSLEAHRYFENLFLSMTLLDMLSHTVAHHKNQSGEPLPIAAPVFSFFILKLFGNFIFLRADLIFIFPKDSKLIFLKKTRGF
ncbi:hypothetical protein ACJX0J_031387, partial [Zea mays]